MVVTVAPTAVVRAGPGDGLLDLGFAVVGDRTVLVSRRQRFPLRCTVPLHLDRMLPDMAWMYVQNPTGVVGAGDHLQLRVVLGPGARVHLTTPSATKVLRMDGGAARQDVVVRVGRDAYVENLPEPIIPHHGSVYDQDTVVHLADGATYIGAETLAPGRLASGEAFEYDRMSLRTTILDSAGREVLVDAVVLEPGRHDPRDRGAFGSHHYYASVVVVGPGAAGDDLAARLDAALAGHEQFGVEAGAGTLAHGAGVLVRILAPSSTSAAAAVRAVWALARRELVGAVPPRSRK